MSIYEIVQRGKAMQKIESDRQFAMANGMDPQNIVDLKSGKSRLNAKNYLKVAKAAGMDLDEALEFLEKVEKQKGFARVPAMLVAAVFAAVTLIVTPYPAEAAPQLKHNSSAVYIMLNRKRMFDRFRSLAFGVFTTFLEAVFVQRKSRNAAMPVRL